MHTDPLEPIQRAIAESYIRSFHIFSHLPGGRFYSRDGLQIIEAPYQEVETNLVLAADIEPSRAEEVVHRTIEAFRVKGLPLAWVIDPLTRPRHLVEILKEIGVLETLHLIGMALDLDRYQIDTTTLPSGLEIERVEDPQTQDIWIDIVEEAYPLPNSFGNLYRQVFKMPQVDSGLLFLGRLNSEPIGTVTLTIEPNRVGGIYDVTTLKSVRRRGIGTAMMQAALAAAKREQLELIVLQASEMGAGMYERMGFKKVSDIYRHTMLAPNNKSTEDA